MRQFFNLLLIASVCFLISSCGINSSIMLKTDKDYNFSQLPDTPTVQYKIAANDLVQFNLKTNDGYKLINVESGNQGQAANGNNRFIGPTYLVEYDGKINLPILNRIEIEGLTIREAEQMLEEKFSEYYQKPFVTLNVTNRRVIVFPGTGGGAKIIQLTNENTTLLEALAAAGGIASNGKAKKVKLIRGNLQNPTVYQIDLSTLKGATSGSLVLQANDIIYVEPLKRLSQGILSEITPIISLITSFLIVFTIRNQIQQ